MTGEYLQHGMPMSAWHLAYEDEANGQSFVSAASNNTASITAPSTSARSASAADIAEKAW